jgi:uncharacterized protein YjbI with pentapeptide repeats
MEDTIPLASSCNLREASLFAANLSDANLTGAGTEAKSAPASEIRRNLFMINP